MAMGRKTQKARSNKLWYLVHGGMKVNLFLDDLPVGNGELKHLDDIEKYGI